MIAAGVAIAPGASRAEALAGVAQAFRTAGIATPELDARILMTEILGLTAIDVLVHGGTPLQTGEAADLSAAAGRRLGGEPVGRILGRREFWGLPFMLSPATLEPRPDTETLVATAIAHARGHCAAPRIIDLGTGSGCVLVSVLHELPDASGLGIDRAPEAIATARQNAAANDVARRCCFAVGDWGQAVTGPFDLVLSNPPYISTDDIAGLAPDVRCHDPRLALDGGSDGLDAYRAIVADLSRLLAPGGLVALEIGCSQGFQVSDLLQATGLERVTVVQDFAGLDRVVSAVRG